MRLSLPRQIQQLIDERVKSGSYASAEDVISAAVTTLDQNEKFGSFSAGELDELLAEGEKDIERGDVLDADEVFAALRKLSKPASSKAR
jgi:putative addiction module CopG family antidote